MGRYIKGLPIKNRSLAEIYRQFQHPEYRSSKSSDSYGKWIDKYEPRPEERKEHSPTAGHVEYRSENPSFKEEKKEDSPELRHLKSEGERKDNQILEQDGLIRKLFQDKVENYQIRKRQEVRDRDGRIEGGTSY